MERRRTVNILQACAVAGVSRRTIYNWLDKGKLEYVRTAGGSVRIFEDTLLTSRKYRRDVSDAGI